VCWPQVDRAVTTPGIAPVMSGICITNSGGDSEWDRFPASQLRASAGLCGSQHELTEAPSDADVILIAGRSGLGLGGEALLRSPVVREFRSKVFVVNEEDFPVPLLPGMYASLRPAQQIRGYSYGGIYFIHHHVLGALDYLGVSSVDDCEHLYSFVGSGRNHATRRSVLALSDTRALLIDSSNTIDSVRYGSLDQQHAGWKVFGDSVRSSKFILCPRGKGPGTMRMFEAMMCGRAPVVISDDWVPTPGPRWDDFVIRVSERDICALPGLLRSRESDAAALGEAALMNWNSWFAPNAVYTTVRDLAMHTVGPTEVSAPRPSLAARAVRASRSREVSRELLATAKRRLTRDHRGSDPRAF
jgi:hypothetical protein